MKNIKNYTDIKNLHGDFITYLENGKLNIKSAILLSDLDLNGEQLWVLNCCKEYNILPTIKQSREINEAYKINRLSIKQIRKILISRLQPKKIVFNYSDLAPFFSLDMDISNIKKETIKILGNWKNNRA